MTTVTAATAVRAGTSGLVRRLVTPEVLTFLAVGGAGYAVDVGAFNALRSGLWSTSRWATWFATADPSYARVVAVALAMVVTYLGNRLVTWRGSSGGDRRREVALFVVLNVVGLGFSVLTLLVSHDLLGLTSRWADNVSANGVGLALGTAFRFWSYRRWVFVAGPPRPDRVDQPVLPAHGGGARGGRGD